MERDGSSGRWERRSHVAGALRVTVLCGPVVASVLAAVAVHRMLPAPVPGAIADALGQLALLVLVSTLALVAVDRLARRLLPLVTLLDLSMLFPDRAPSRLRVARQAIRRRPIEEQLARVREAGADPGAVAREILTLVAALSAHDRPTRGHAERVRMFTDLLAEQLRVPSRDRDLLRWAAILHDIGKLKVPSTLLNKPGKPTPDEWTVLRSHPVHGAEMAAGLLPWLGEWAEVILEHHERYDGTGYPVGLSGPGISLGARIVAVADAYDVMTAARAYKRPVSRAAALRELVRWSGTQFDPAVVRAMVALGAPRLRRTQGVLAWLADVPIVASGAVPASTVARVVGVGALATGAVAGGVPAAAVSAEPTPRAATTQAASVTGGPSRSTGAAQGPDDARVPGAAGPTTVPTPRRARPQGLEADSPAGPTHAPGPAAAAVGQEPAQHSPGTATPPGRGGAGSGSTPSVPAPSPTSSPPAAPTPVPIPPVTVGGVVGSVSGTVSGATTDPVGTVGSVVTDPTGTITGTLGSLSGSSNSGSGNSGSGNSGSGSNSSGSGSGGLLGGLPGH